MYELNCRCVTHPSQVQSSSANIQLMPPVEEHSQEHGFLNLMASGLWALMPTDDMLLGFWICLYMWIVVNQWPNLQRIATMSSLDIKWLLKVLTAWHGYCFPKSSFFLYPQSHWILPVVDVMEWRELGKEGNYEILFVVGLRDQHSSPSSPNKVGSSENIIF